jgi:hypothetical protein
MQDGKNTSEDSFARTAKAPHTPSNRVLVKVGVLIHRRVIARSAPSIAVIAISDVASPE